MLKLQTNTASEAGREEVESQLRGERLTVGSPEEDRWPVGFRILVLILLAAIAWALVLLLPSLVNDLADAFFSLLLRVAE